MELFVFEYQDLDAKVGTNPSTFLKIHWCSFSKEVLFINVMIPFEMFRMSSGVFIAT